jgi:hypothetical protein
MRPGLGMLWNNERGEVARSRMGQGERHDASDTHTGTRSPDPPCSERARLWSILASSTPAVATHDDGAHADNGESTVDITERRAREQRWACEWWPRLTDKLLGAEA